MAMKPTTMRWGLSEKALVDRAAEADGVSFSDYVRSAALMRAARQFDGELSANEIALLDQLLDYRTHQGRSNMSDATPNPRMALYGSLWLDRGEKMDKVHEQIDGMHAMVIEKKLEPPVFAFDVVFNEDQHEEVQRILVEIEDAIHTAFADGDGHMTVLVSGALKPKRGQPKELPGKEFVMRMIESGESAAEYMQGLFGDNPEATERGFTAKTLPATKRPPKAPAAQRPAAAKRKKS